MPQFSSKNIVPWVYCAVLTSAILGGAGFAFMKDSLSIFPISWFIFWRFFLSTAILFPLLASKAWKAPRQTLKDGIFIGCLFFLATLIQLQGIARTDAGRSAFINSTSLVIVPMLQAVLTRKAPSFKTVAGCLLCLCGVAFLSLGKIEGNADGQAELFVFIGTCLFAYQIVFFRRAVQRGDPQVLSFIEFGVIALLSLPIALFDPLPPLESGKGWGGVLYAATMMNIVMIMISNNALRYITPTSLAVIGSTQSVHGAIFGAVLLGEAITLRLVASGILIFAGIIVVIFCGNTTAPPAQESRHL